MPKLDLSKGPVQTGSIYRTPYASLMAGRALPPNAAPIGRGQNDRS